MSAWKRGHLILVVLVVGPSNLSTGFHEFVEMTDVLWDTDPTLISFLMMAITIMWSVLTFSDAERKCLRCLDGDLHMPL